MHHMCSILAACSAYIAPCHNHHTVQYLGCQLEDIRWLATVACVATYKMLCACTFTTVWTCSFGQHALAPRKPANTLLRNARQLM